MNHLEITLMNELTNEYVTNKNTCDELIQKINQTQKLLESLEREYDLAKEKRIKAEQKIDEQFYFLVDKENRKDTRKTIELDNKIIELKSDLDLLLENNEN